MDKLTLLALKLQNFTKDEQGQDLVEYALVVALVAFGAILGMKGLATDINTAFNNVGNTLNTYIP